MPRLIASRKLGPPGAEALSSSGVSITVGSTQDDPDARAHELDVERFGEAAHRELGGANRPRAAASRTARPAEAMLISREPGVFFSRSWPR